MDPVANGSAKRHNSEPITHGAGGGGWVNLVGGGGGAAEESGERVEEERLGTRDRDAPEGSARVVR